MNQTGDSQSGRSTGPTLPYGLPCFSLMLLDVHYGQLIALRNVSFSVLPRKRVFGVITPIIVPGTISAI